VALEPLRITLRVSPLTENTSLALSAL
jgi:hypothetical protein